MYDYKTPPMDDEELRRMRRAANANLARVAAGEYRITVPKKPRRAPASADMIASGHMVLEMRELIKIEARYSRDDAKGKLSDDDRAAWEEVDARLDTLREALKAHDKKELTSFVRAYNAAQKRKA